MDFSKLAPISLVGAVACIGMAKIFSNAVSDKFKNSQLYKEAIEIFKSHPGAKEILGEPIEDGAPDCRQKSLFFNGFYEFKTMVTGPKARGVLFVTSIGDDLNTLKLDTIQLEVGNDKSKRLIIKEPEPRNVNLTNHGA